MTSVLGGAFLCAAGISLSSACETAPRDLAVRTDNVALHVTVAGKGPPVLFIPSIGRGAEDFQDLAAQVSAAGFTAILPAPRGVGANLGALATSDLTDLADDALAVAKAVCGGEAAVMVGQGFGSRIARLASARDPAQVSGLVLLAADDGQPVADDLREAMSNAVAQGFRSERSRLEGLQTAFFAKGNDAKAWQTGWFPLVAAAQNRAGKRTDLSLWLTGGAVRILLVQGENDPVQTPQDGRALAGRMGERAQLVLIPQASHALLPEQPEAVAAAVLAFLKGEPVDPALIEPHIRNRQGKMADCGGRHGGAGSNSCAPQMETSSPPG